ncbi:Glycosyltransferase involved in cell wall bisynthesis [Prevotella sp. tc2-28]|nr:Glycosyltransferase involved in cell wall bisynthesis [Prevotella sp. tc2-28]
MKILHVINSLSSGGAERLVTDLMRKMNNDDYELETLIFSNKADVYSKGLIADGYVVHKLADVSIYNLLFVVPKLIIFFRKHNYDIIHVHLFPGMYYISLLKRFHCIKCPIIFHEHNTSNGRLEKPMFRLIDRFVYKPYKKIICISEAVSQMLTSVYHLSSDKICTIQNGIDLDRCKQARPVMRKVINKNLSKDDILIIMVARFNKQKDHLTLLNALARMPNKFKLALLGEGEREEELREMVSEQNLSKRVFFCGYKSNVYDYIKSSDVFVLSSFFEGFGLSCIEAMACGIPVVISNVPGLADVVGFASEKFEVGDIDGLIESIYKLIFNKDIYKEKVLMGLKQARLYSEDKMISDLGRLYKYVVNEGESNNK